MMIIMCQRPCPHAWSWHGCWFRMLPRLRAIPRHGVAWFMAPDNAHGAVAVFPGWKFWIPAASINFWAIPVDKQGAVRGRVSREGQGAWLARSASCGNGSPGATCQPTQESLPD
jgi:hypothetical protein